MIQHLAIKNLGIIESIELDLQAGFQVITGETGSGKSMLLNAVGLLAGDKASKDLIRRGASKALVQAVISFSPEQEQGLFNYLLTNNYLDDNELKETQTATLEIIIAREIKQSGNGICRINGQIVRLEELKKLSPFWLDIQTQGESRLLYQDESHLKLLDTYASKQKEFALDSTLKSYKQAYLNFHELNKKRTQLSMDEKKRQELLDWTAYQINEIEKINPQINEDEDLKKKIKIQQAKEKLASSFQNAQTILQGEQEENSVAIFDSLANAISLIENSPFQGEIKEKIIEKLTIAKEAVVEVENLLTNTLEQIKFDPSLLEKLHSRQDLLFKLMKKYGPKLADVLQFLEEKKRYHQALENSYEALLRLEENYKNSQNEVLEIGNRLSKIRETAAQKLEKEILDVCELLHLKSAALRVQFEKFANKEIQAEGLERVFFEVEMNSGEGYKSLAKVVSGGEAARLMLALKYIIYSFNKNEYASEKFQDPTEESTPEQLSTKPLVLIFDEIDSGVSGKVAKAVGEMMKSMSERGQVICVTHNPTIASLANEHYRIYKEEYNQRICSFVKLLSEEERIEELALLLSGRKKDEKSLSLAKSLLEHT